MITGSECINKTDEQIVVLTLKNQKFYLCLMKRYETKLLNYILKISNTNREDGEDILQEVFIKAYQNLNDFDLNYKFSNWIYSIAHNTTISAFRKKKVRPQTVSWEDKDLNNILESTLDAENTSLHKLTYKQILKIINQLPLKYKDVLILKFVEGKDYQEISDILHKPMGTIATLINRAKKSLKQELEKEDIKF
ncbi:sigma-70 family RNA polymerase sigma factor [bacterium]|nr:sigma-70 family RNA polymerase sigma factor [Candidatus Atribacteria bacterium]MBU4046932.1 sigma-70 family RNA polymerase sigma factor [bacterium]MBU4562967.1 sigma-70 family RNA polymerase sigma factor [bacterium]